MAHHTHDPICPACEEKLKQAHTSMVGWYRKKKSTYPDLHIAWSYRGKEDQEQAYAEGRTRAHYPASPHNRVNPKTQEPESYALDLFQLTDAGIAKFDPIFYARIADEMKRDGDELIWGGHFKSLGDFDHFQYNPESKT